MADKSIIEFILGLIYPYKCPLCLDIIPHDRSQWFCDECSPKIGFVVGGKYCRKCGRVHKSEYVCNSCAGRRFAFEKNRAIALYDDSMQFMIYKFKYGKHAEYGRSLGRIMAEKYKDFFDEKMDLIMPVPISKKKLHKRGFNQSELLAKEIAAKIKIPLCKNALIRILDTKPQSSLSAIERERNVAAAFRYNRLVDIKGKNILLVDDIFTTGSTIAACTKLLLLNGAAKVYSYTLSITE